MKDWKQSVYPLLKGGYAMKISLPRVCTGREITDAFKAAASFQETPETRWEAQEFNGNSSESHISHDCGSEPRGVRVARYRLKKSWIICGKKVWKKDPLLLTFVLPAIDPHASYSQVAVVFEYDCGDAGDGYSDIAADPAHWKCGHVREGVETLIKRFTTTLKDAQATVLTNE